MARSNGDVHTFGDGRDEIVRHAQNTGVPFKINDTTLSLGIANGQTRHRLYVWPHQAETIRTWAFDQFLVLGDLEAFHDKSKRLVEAVIRPAIKGYTDSNEIRAMPGLEVFEKLPNSDAAGKIIGGLKDLPPPIPGEREYNRVGGEEGSRYGWRLPIVNAPAGTQVEISQVSNTLFELLDLPDSIQHGVEVLSIKIKNVLFEQHDECLNYAESVGLSILFDLNLRFGAVWSLARIAWKTSIHRRETRLARDDKSIFFPKIRYSVPATTLYFYAKSESDNPIVCYLAYYQAIEHFFPKFFNKQVVERVREKLEDRFDPADDHDVQTLIQLASEGKRPGGNEPEQLAATLSQSLNAAEMIGFFKENDETRAFMTAEQSYIQGIPQLSLSTAGIIKSISKRIYALRCRIVHTKDRANASAEPLLRYSREVGFLGYDIGLIEFICEKVIIAGNEGTF